MKYFLLLISSLLMFSCSEMPNEVPLDSHRSVVFNLDMSEAINNGLFESDPDTLTLILDSTSQFEMSDENSDNIFLCTVPNLIFGETYEYGYAINGVAENLEPGRSFTVYDEGNIISDYYGELNPTIVTFLVNMSYQIELGNFDSGSQFLDVAGDFQDPLWSGSQLESIGNDIYSTTITNIEVGQNLEFKFRIDGDWNNSEFPDNGPDRSHQVEQGENTLEYWYNDEGGN